MHRAVSDTSSAAFMPPVVLLKCCVDVSPLILWRNRRQPIRISLAPLIALESLLVVIPLLIPVATERPSRILTERFRIATLKRDVRVDQCAVAIQRQLARAEIRERAAPSGAPRHMCTPRILMLIPIRISFCHPHTMNKLISHDDTKMRRCR